MKRYTTWIAGAALGACTLPAGAQQIPSLPEVIGIGLENNYAIKLDGRRIEAARGEWISYKGAFDPVVGFDGSSLSGIQPDMEKKDASSLDLYLRIPTGWGVSFTAGLNYSRLYDLTNQGVSEFANGVWTQLDIPLLQGFGKYNRDRMNRQIARLKLLASRVTFDYTTTTFIKDVILSYAQVYCNYQSYLSQRAIIYDFRQYKNDIRQKIEKNLIPAADMINVDAELISLESDLDTYALALKTSCNELMKLVGTDIAPPADPAAFSMPFSFPAIDESKIRSYILHVQHEEEAILQKSLPFQKQKLEEESAFKEVKAAKNEKKHQLNFQFKYNYFSEKINGNWHSFFIFPESKYPGSSYLFTLNYRFPLGNHKSKGYYMAKKEAYDMQKESTRQVLFEQRKAIDENIMSLTSSTEMYTVQTKMAGLYQQVYANEVLKYSIGQSSQMNVLKAHQDFVKSSIVIYEKEYRLISDWIALKYLCDELPKTSSELKIFTVF